MFVIVATGTYLTDDRTSGVESVAFAPIDEHAGPTPVILDKLGRWAAVAIVVALLSYAGPIAQELTIHSYLAPGMRTW